MVRQDPKIHGDVPGLPVGLMFADRGDVFNSGLHGQLLAGISGTQADGGAFSIVLNDGYEDDEDKGETITYTGEGKGKPGQEPNAGKTQQADQDMNWRGNAALKQNVESGLPVRVIRGCKGNIKYAPLQGYRYDGLYNVERAYTEIGKAGFKMCKFELKRCEVPQQDPLPLSITGEGPSDSFWSPNGRETLAVREVNSRSAPETPTAARSIQQRNQEITGKKKLPVNLSFKKNTATAV
ncbi:PUA-like domain-containing protein [Mycena capillaripes]|nr:PUA-like domain-containing protein [Mycena capillaripes]